KLLLTKQLAEMGEDAGGESVSDGLFEEAPREQVEDSELQKAAITVWLLDSTITEPTLEDIYRAGKSEKFEEAFAHLLAAIKEKNLEFVFNKIELPLMPVLRRM